MKKLFLSEQEKSEIRSLHETEKKASRKLNEQSENESVAVQMKKVKPDPGCDYMFETKGAHGYWDLLYKVKPGDTLESIANERKPLTVERIKKYNPKIKGDMIKAGCVIKLVYPMGD